MAPSHSQGARGGSVSTPEGSCRLSGDISDGLTQTPECYMGPTQPLGAVPSPGAHTPDRGWAFCSREGTSSAPVSLPSWNRGCPSPPGASWDSRPCCTERGPGKEPAPAVDRRSEAPAPSAWPPLSRNPTVGGTQSHPAGGPPIITPDCPVSLACATPQLPFPTLPCAPQPLPQGATMDTGPSWTQHPPSCAPSVPRRRSATRGYRKSPRC